MRLLAGEYDGAVITRCDDGISTYFDIVNAVTVNLDNFSCLEGRFVKKHQFSFPIPHNEAVLVRINRG